MDANVRDLKYDRKIAEEIEWFSTLWRHQDDPKSSVRHIFMYSSFDILVFFLTVTNVSNLFHLKTFPFDCCVVIYLVAVVLVQFVRGRRAKSTIIYIAIHFGHIVSTIFQAEFPVSILRCCLMPFIFLLTGLRLTILICLAVHNMVAYFMFLHFMTRNPQETVDITFSSVLATLFLFIINFSFGLAIYFQIFLVSNFVASIRMKPWISLRLIPQLEIIEYNAFAELPVGFLVGQGRHLSLEEHLFFLLRLFQHSNCRNVILYLLHHAHLAEPTKRIADDHISIFYPAFSKSPKIKKRSYSFDAGTSCSSEQKRVMSESSNAEASLKQFLGKAILQFFLETYPNRTLASNILEVRPWFVARKYLETALTFYNDHLENRCHMKTFVDEDNSNDNGSMLWTFPHFCQNQSLPVVTSELKVLKHGSIISLKRRFPQSYTGDEDLVVLIESKGYNFLFPLRLLLELERYFEQFCPIEAIFCVLCRYSNKRWSRWRNTLKLTTTSLLRHINSLHSWNFRGVWEHDAGCTDALVQKVLIRKLSLQMTEMEDLIKMINEESRDTHDTRHKNAFEPREWNGKWSTLYFSSRIVASQMENRGSKAIRLKTRRRSRKTFRRYTSNSWNLARNHVLVTHKAQPHLISRDSPYYSDALKLLRKTLKLWSSQNLRCLSSKFSNIKDYEPPDRLTSLYNTAKAAVGFARSYAIAFSRIRVYYKRRRRVHTPSQSDGGSFQDTKIERWFLVWSSYAAAFIIAKLRWVHALISLLQLLLYTLSMSLWMVMLKDHDYSYGSSTIVLSVATLVFHILMIVYTSRSNCYKDNGMRHSCHLYKLRNAVMALTKYAMLCFDQSVASRGCSVIVTSSSLYLDLIGYVEIETSVTETQRSLMILSIVLKETALNVSLMSLPLFCFYSERTTKHLIFFVTCVTLLIGPFLGHLTDTWPRNVKFGHVKDNKPTQQLVDGIEVNSQSNLVTYLCHLLYLYIPPIIFYYVVNRAMQQTLREAFTDTALLYLTYVDALQPFPYINLNWKRTTDTDSLDNSVLPISES